MMSSGITWMGGGAGNGPWSGKRVFCVKTMILKGLEFKWLVPSFLIRASKCCFPASQVYARPPLKSIISDNDQPLSLNSLSHSTALFEISFNKTSRCQFLQMEMIRLLLPLYKSLWILVPVMRRRINIWHVTQTVATHLSRIRMRMRMMLSLPPLLPPLQSHPPAVIQPKTQPLHWNVTTNQLPGWAKDS